jgi:hypothetical protein
MMYFHSASVETGEGHTDSEHTVLVVVLPLLVSRAKCLCRKCH